LLLLWPPNPRPRAVVWLLLRLLLLLLPLHLLIIRHSLLVSEDYTDTGTRAGDTVCPGRQQDPNQ